MGLRPRATGVVVHHGKILLVRDEGRHRYSLPGGGIHRGEPVISAVARELFEETGLIADKIERVCTHRGATQEHRVFLITAHHGRMRLKSEIDGCLWWDGSSDIPTFAHVRVILKALKMLE